MQTLGHVGHLQPVLHLALGIVKVLVLTVIDLFLLERAHEARGDAVLLRAAFVGHTDVDAVCQQTVGMHLSNVLCPLVGMENEGTVPCRQCLVQRFERQFLC
mgnify:CR=1 FL=1